MSKQTINIGASPNDGTGTPLRTSFDYTNQNFTELYTALGGGVGLPGATTQVIFNDGGTNLAGDAGLVYNKTTDTLTAGNAAITGAATVGTTLGVTGNSTLTGSVGIGVAPAQKLTVLVADAAQSAQFRAASGYVRLRPYVDATNGGIIDATNTSESAYSNLTILANSLRLFGNSASGLTVGATGDVTVGAGNVVMGTSGKGIDFSAVTGGTGTATANVLNDYEEGTWTIGLTFGGGSTGITTSANTGRYTKIGRQVTVIGYLALTSKGSSTGAANITGLPFTSANSLDSISASCLRFNVVSYTGTIQGVQPINTTKIELDNISEAGAVTSLTDANFSNTSSIMISSTYFV